MRILTGYMLPSEVITAPTPTPESPWDISFSEIEGVEIRNVEQGQTLELSRNSEGAWVESATEDGRVDGELVEQSLHWLAAPRVSRVISTEGGLKQFGLDEPVGIIKVITHNDDIMVLLIGNVSPLGNQTYTIIPNTSKVLLINNIDVNSIMDLVGMDLLLAPLSEETQTDMEPKVP
jgi:hypothetical protein